MTDARKATIGILAVILSREFVIDDHLTEETVLSEIGIDSLDAVSLAVHVEDDIHFRTLEITAEQEPLFAGPLSALLDFLVPYYTET